MCGVLGFIEKLEKIEAEKILGVMANQTKHRGPDNTGIWYYEEDGVALGHNRLSILDLSVTANQPMVSPSGRYVIVFNGEIYNHLAIRSELELLGNKSWVGHSDTETILFAIEQWGIDFAIRKFTGMFAIAIWDKQKKELSLLRDRMGEKPLYYGWVKGVFLFGSELKALKKHKAFTGEIDKQSLSLYLKLVSFPEPFSIYKDIFKVEPGTIISVKLDGTIKKSSYWKHPSFKSHTKKTFNGSYQTALDDLDKLLSRSVNDQMIADVPIGAFLSGGIDSSLIVALMQKVSGKQVNTYSISFDDKRYDESEYAESVAEYLGTNHHTRKITSEDLLNTVKKIPKIYDEPFSDSSQIPSYLVSQFASNDVKVILTGDGADELFGGYNRYTLTDKYWLKIKNKPILLRKILKSMSTKLSERSWDRISSVFSKTLTNYNIEMLGNKMYKASNFLDCQNDIEFYEKLVFIEQETDLILNEHEEHQFFKSHYSSFLHIKNPTELIMALDQSITLTSQILTKVDRATMSNSLESRIPFLDHKVVEFASSLPIEYKILNGNGKRIVKDILYKYIPEKYFSRPKRGFGVPVDEWLRGDLKVWAEELLFESGLKEDSIFNHEYLKGIWKEHLSGKRNHANRLWSILMFQSWLKSVD